MIQIALDAVRNICAAIKILGVFFSLDLGRSPGRLILFVDVL